MTLEQLLVITQLLNQVDPISIREDKDVGDDYWALDLGDGKEIDIYSNGSQFWWLNDKLHREDGPAAIYADGTQRWWLNGELHRADGPAIYADGTQRWYLNGKKLSEAEHAKAVAKLLKQETK